MADVKISALTDGAPAQATDEVPARRAGGNVKLALSAILAYVQGAIGIAQSQVSGLLAALSALATADTTEANTRASADTTLQTNITSEASTRATADSTHAGLTTSVHGIPDTSKLRATGRTTFSNANVSAVAGDVYLAQTGTLSAARTVTLPAANAVAAGYELVVADESGSVTDANTITVQRAGADTINGLTSVLMVLAYSALRFVSDGSSKWTVLGLLRIPATTYLCASNNFVPANPATAEFPNFGIEGAWVVTDLSNVTQMRALGRSAIVSGADLTLEARIQYATNFTSPTWAAVDGSAGPAVNLGTSGGNVGSWVNITAAARTNVMLRAVTVSATAVQLRVPWLGLQIR